MGALLVLSLVVPVVGGSGAVAVEAPEHATIHTVAGGGEANGPATAWPVAPESVAVGPDGTMYVADGPKHQVVAVAPDDTIRRFAGTGVAGFSGEGGPATAAQLDRPEAVAVAPDGTVYIGDDGARRILRVDATTGVLTTYAGVGHDGDQGDGGPATAAQIGSVGDLVVDDGGILYVSQPDSSRVRRIDATGTIDAFAGTGASGSSGDGGPATAAQLTFPTGLALAPDGDLVVADPTGQRIRRVDAATGDISTVAGDGTGGFSGDGGPATAAQLQFPDGVVVDADGDVWVADTSNHRVRRVDADDGTISTEVGDGMVGFAGDGGPAADARVWDPVDLALGSDALLIADLGNKRVRRVSAASTITTVAGNGSEGFSGDGGPATEATMARPADAAVLPDGDLLIADDRNHRVRRIDAVTNEVTTFAGSERSGSFGDGGPATDAALSFPKSVVVGAGGEVFITDHYGHRVRRVAPDGTISTYAGGSIGYDGDGGPSVDAKLRAPRGLALDAAGNLFIVDSGNHVIRKVDATTETITTVAGTGTDGFSGDGGPATAALLADPDDVVVAANGDLFISDTSNNRIRRVDATTGIIQTVAGSGSTAFGGDGGPPLAAGLGEPAGLALDVDGALLVADTNNARIRRVDLSVDVISTVVGDGARTFAGDCDLAADASLLDPGAVALDADGDLLVVDTGNHRVRRVGRLEPFADVTATGTFGRDIGWMWCTGLSRGTPQATGLPLYKPVDPVSRQAMAAFLYRFAGEPPVSSTPLFADVASNHAFFDAIQWMAEAGISTGTAQPSGLPLYKPVDPVSRQAMAAFLHRLAGSAPPASTSPHFADVGSGRFFEDIQWMFEAGISTGTAQPSGPPLYKPLDPVSRQAMAAFLHRFSAQV